MADFARMLAAANPGGLALALPVLARDLALGTCALRLSG